MKKSVRQYKSLIDGNAEKLDIWNEKFVSHFSKNGMKHCFRDEKYDVNSDDDEKKVMRIAANDVMEMPLDVTAYQLRFYKAEENFEKVLDTLSSYAEQMKKRTVWFEYLKLFMLKKGEYESIGNYFSRAEELFDSFKNNNVELNEEIKVAIVYTGLEKDAEYMTMYSKKMAEREGYEQFKSHTTRYYKKKVETPDLGALLREKSLIMQHTGTPMKYGNSPKKGKGILSRLSLHSKGKDKKKTSWLGRSLSKLKK